MNWPLGLSRFIHGLSHFAGPSQEVNRAEAFRPPLHAAMRPRTSFSIEREVSILPALICALFDFEGRCGAWPPRRVTELLDLAGLDRVTGGLHLQGPNLPQSFFPRTSPRGCRLTLLLEGLAALDSGLVAETGATFDELSPTLRGYVLSAFERGELGFAQDAAERFMDCLVETVTFAFLNWEPEPDPMATAAANGVRPS